MKTLITVITIVVALGLNGCYYNFNSFNSMQHAFTSACSYDSIKSDMQSKDNTITFIATCTRAK